MAGHNPQMMNSQMHNTQTPLPATQGPINNQNQNTAAGQTGAQTGTNARHPMGFRRIPPNRHRPLTGDTLSIHEAAKRVIILKISILF